MNLRKSYRNCHSITYDELRVRGVFYAEERFSKKYNVEKLMDKFDKYDGKSRVWLLFGKKKKKDALTCLQVAQSKDSVISEIKKAIDGIFSKTIIKYKKTRDSAFYVKVCPARTKKHTYREVLYYMIGQEYKYFRICFLNVDKYLNISSSQCSSDSNRIIEICKHEYAEAKIAFQTLAIYWRLYKSGIDGQTIDYICKHMDDYREKSSEAAVDVSVNP